ncbi:MAG: hypothetical protein ACI9JN_002430 [Bacteroidia bacterium]|jgi:hypothetical protein
MKKNIYYSVLAAAVVGVTGLLANFSVSQETVYQPRQQEQETTQTFIGAQEYLNSLRANQYTGIVDPADVAQAKAELKQFYKTHGKASFPLSWSFAGPDNRGGRTRALLVDRNDNKTLFAGGVMGGLFKSTNKGASWYPINDQFEDMAISSICQTLDGTIYFGTGESFTGGGGQEAFTPGFRGGGIYKSTDNGKTFDKIPSTSGYAYVNKVVAHPSKNIVFAATNTGLRVSTEGNDAIWTSMIGGNARDFVIDKNGTALLYTNTVYRSENPTTTGSYSAVDGIPLGGVSRIAIAVSESDPAYSYIVVVGSVTFNGPTGQATAGSGLVGVYQSKDNGKNFAKIIGNASSFFAPWSIPGLATGPTTIHSQGGYDLCVAVHPNNRERIFMGGIQFAEWTPETGARIVGNNNDSKANPFGIHADKHYITFDTKSDPIIMYITSDGGVSRTTNAELSNYTTLYNGYGTTQFYGIAGGNNGVVVGGTQDNNSMVIDGKGNTPQSAEDIIGGDGFQCEVSEINPDIIFAESQNGNMRRSLNAGGSPSPIWDSRLAGSGEPASLNTDGTIRQGNNIFNTPMRLWEDLEDSSSRLFFAMDRGVWMANDAVLSPNPQWFKLAATSFAPHVMEITADGGNLFVSSTNSSSLSRIDGLNITLWDTAALTGATISDSLSIRNINSNLPTGRSVTDIEVDQNDPNRVIVTLGNYGNSSHVYITLNALDDVPTWRSIQGALPSFPVYDAEISVDDPSNIILGTEYGIYYAQNGTATTPTWTYNKDSIPRVPVFMIRQVEEKIWKSGKRTGAVLYAGTHGRGIWKSSSMLTSVKSVKNDNSVSIKAYPNPAQSNVTIDMAVRGADDLTIEVLNYHGQVIQTSKVRVYGTETSIGLDVSNMPAGNYIISIKGSQHQGAAKLIKVD